MERKPIVWFLDNGCELTQPEPLMFLGVYAESNGDPCKECNCKDTCPAWPKLNQERLGSFARTWEVRPRCLQCGSLLNMTKVARRGGKCACGKVIDTPAPS